MHTEEKKELEIEILKLTDKLIEKVILLDDEDIESKNAKYEDSINVAQCLGVKILEYLDGKNELLESMLNQLTRQKLPDNKILQSFKSFTRNLSIIIKDAIDRLEKDNLEKNLNIPLLKREENPITADNLAEILTEVGDDLANLSKDHLGLAFNEEKEETNNDHQYKEVKTTEDILRIIFRNKNIIKKYKLGYKSMLDYFVPDLNLGIIVNDNKTYYRTNIGISETKPQVKIITISKEQANNYLLLSRTLRKYIS